MQNVPYNRFSAVIDTLVPEVSSLIRNGLRVVRDRVGALKSAKSTLARSSRWCNFNPSSDIGA
jgi:hypothetical protein